MTQGETGVGACVVLRLLDLLRDLLQVSQILHDLASTFWNTRRRRFAYVMVLLSLAAGAVTMAVVVVVEFFHLGCLGNVPPEGLSRFIFWALGLWGSGWF